MYYVTLFDGSCDEAKELKALSGSMSNDVKWIISSSGRYMFLKLTVDYDILNSYVLLTGLQQPSTAFLANIHYGK